MAEIDERPWLGDVLNPDWNEGEHTRDWRKHVGERVRQLWPTFSLAQKIAITLDADDRASDEKWELP